MTHHEIRVKPKSGIYQQLRQEMNLETMHSLRDASAAVTVTYLVVVGAHHRGQPPAVQHQDNTLPYLPTYLPCLSAVRKGEDNVVRLNLMEGGKTTQDNTRKICDFVKNT